MRINIWIRNDAVSELFKNFRSDSENWKKFKRSLIGRMAHKAKEEMREKISQDFPQSEHRNPKYMDRMIDAALVQAGDPEERGDYLYRFIHVLGTNEKNSGTYRLRFFNAESAGNKNIRKWSGQRWVEKEERAFQFETDGQEALEYYIKNIENGL